MKQNFFRFIQTRNLFAELSSLLLYPRRFTRDVLQIFRRQFTHESWGEKIQRRLRTSDEEVVRTLFHNIVHKPLASDLVI